MSATLESLERLALGSESSPETSRRMLVIVNPYASTVSDRLRNLVVYALQGRYDVEAVDTQAKGHATELCREAAHEGYDVVVSFGGDGTVNEAVNGLAGSTTPLFCLPGGRTNVLCRILGIPNEIVDATEHLLRLADDWHPRRIPLGAVNGRLFTFSSGVGLDASVVRRVDAHPQTKVRLGEWYFTWVAFSVFARRYVVNPPRMRVEAAGETVEGVTAVVQNGDPYTYFNRRPVKIGAPIELDELALTVSALRRASPVDMPTVLWRALARNQRVARHRQVTSWDDVHVATITSVDGRPIPLQVDGDYIGDVAEARYELRPDALTIVA